MLSKMKLLNSKINELSDKLECAWKEIVDLKDEIIDRDSIIRTNNETIKELTKHLEELSEVIKESELTVNTQKTSIFYMNNQLKTLKEAQGIASN